MEGLRQAVKELDIRETGAPKEGVLQKSDRRLFMQFLAFGGVKSQDALAKAVAQCPLEAVLYDDLNDPQGAGLLLMAEDPALFVTALRPFLLAEPFASVQQKQELTMMGRTYGLGREPDLEDWLLKKPRRNVFNPANSWAIWYPLRRKPEFELLSPQDQGRILAEHGAIGRSYGEHGFAQDVRLACHGLDKNDNEFVIGLVGPELFPLSRIIQDMRKTEQTAKYIQSLGPFFTGRVRFQKP
ncbi:MAG: hypothetical protein A2Y02_00410 [Omnitrophica bacterium GWA2_52_12]|nr:MAG: hypothetical protein A2Y02_00410 [Omnitrophica bacterium GWA2_52_12]